jgi:hypothetical protein
MVDATKARAKYLLDNYKLTIEQWDIIDAYQNHVCFVCGQPNPNGRRLSTDHRWSDGLIRGLLCSRCNPILGKLENTFIRYGLHKVEGITMAGILARLAVYLRYPPAPQALGMDVFGYPGKTGTKKHRKLLKKLSKEKAKR